MDNSRHTGTPSKHEDEVCSSDEDEVCSSDVDLAMFDASSSDEDDCCHHVKKVSTNVQIFSIFITSLIITN
jgi:hypothetical protein